MKNNPAPHPRAPPPGVHRASQGRMAEEGPPVLAVMAGPIPTADMLRDLCELSALAQHDREELGQGHVEPVAGWRRVSDVEGEPAKGIKVEKLYGWRERKPAVLRRELHHAVALWVAHANGVEQVVVDAYQLLQEAVTSPDCPANKLLGVGLLVLAPRAVTQRRG